MGQLQLPRHCFPDVLGALRAGRYRSRPDGYALR